MEEDASARLQIEVEQIVRPVRAMYDTKSKMREELYAHLLALYEEERPRAADGETVIRAALARLGNLAELRRRLQSSVASFEVFSWYLNLEFLPFLKQVGFRKRGETDLHRAARVATIHVVICIIVYGIIAGAILWLRIAFPGVSVGVPHPILGGLWVGGANWVIIFAMHLLGPRFVDRVVGIGGRSSRWYALMLAGGLFMFCCGLGMMASVAVVIEGSLHLRFNLGGLFIFGSIVAGRMLGCQFYGHRSEEWLSLPATKQ